MRVLVSKLEIPENGALYVPDLIVHTGYTRLDTITQLQVYRLMFIEKFGDLWLRIDFSKSQNKKLVYNVEPGQKDSNNWYNWYALQEIKKMDHGLYESA